MSGGLTSEEHFCEGEGGSNERWGGAWVSGDEQDERHLKDVGSG